MLDLTPLLFYCRPLVVILLFQLLNLGLAILYLGVEILYLLSQLTDQFLLILSIVIFLSLKQLILQFLILC